MTVRVPFEKLRVAVGDGWREVARFTCVRCAGHGEVPLVRQVRGFNPESTIERVQHAGWKIRGSRVECPRCQKQREAARPPLNDGMVKVNVMADSKLREATPAERMKIRKVLDEYFDDQAGIWLDGWSDQKAGEHCGVPWALVTRIREAAYGPIRVDPEVAGLRAELVNIQRDVQALTEKFEADRKALNGKLETAAKRLEALQARRAA